MTRSANRYWGNRPVPKAKAEFFNAVTTPAPSGEGKVATIRLYGPIDSWGGWWGINTKEVGAVLDALPESVEQIILRINSPGGEVFEGVSILNMLRAHKATITAVVDGLAASAASVIAAGADETVMSPGTQMMIHKPSVIMWGDADGLRHEAGVLDSIESSLIEIYRDKAGEKDWARLLAEETWFNAAEAVEAGLADRTAVIPDAGETETVGAEPITTDDDGDGEIEDLILLRPAARSRERVAASMLPVSTEPGDPNRKEEAVAYSDLTAGLRERLGVTDADATDETLLEALDQALEEQAETPAASAATTTLPEGVVAMDAAALQELQAQAALGAQARAQQESDRRDAIVKDALKEGRITAASSADWRARLDKDEDEFTKVLASFPKNSAMPTDEIGHSDKVTDADDALYGRVFTEPTKEA
jgi:ATP-dependent protease ClpP protease subunit